MHDLISAELLHVGDLLRSSRKTPGPASAEAIVNEQGHIKLLRYGKNEDGTWINDVSQDDEIFKTPSRVAKRVTKQQSEDGPKFWIVVSTEKTLHALINEYKQLKR